MSFELRFEYDVVDNYGLQDELDVGEGVILMMAIKGGYLAMFSILAAEHTNLISSCWASVILLLYTSFAIR